MMDLFLTYPVPVLNWSDRLAGPSLAEIAVAPTRR
jgi:hypothetical protein